MIFKSSHYDHNLHHHHGGSHHSSLSSKSVVTQSSPLSVQIRESSTPSSNANHDAPFNDKITSGTGNASISNNDSTLTLFQAAEIRLGRGSALGIGGTDACQSNFSKTSAMTDNNASLPSSSLAASSSSAAAASSSSTTTMATTVNMSFGSHTDSNSNTQNSPTKKLYQRRESADLFLAAAAKAEEIGSTDPAKYMEHIQKENSRKQDQQQQQQQQQNFPQMPHGEKHDYNQLPPLGASNGYSMNMKIVTPPSVPLTFPSSSSSTTAINMHAQSSIILNNR